MSTDMNITVKITEATLDDLKGIMEVERESFDSYWSEEELKREIIGTDGFVVVAKHEGRVLGYGLFILMYDEIHISKLAVLPEFRRMGMGSVLLKALLDTAVFNKYYDITLEVRVSNIGAIALYEKFGFKTEGVRKHYYNDNNEDALIMWLHMKEGKKDE